MTDQNALLESAEPEDAMVPAGNAGDGSDDALISMLVDRARS